MIPMPTGCRSTTLIFLIGLLAMAGNATSAPAIYKCTVNGEVSYQSSPCPAGKKHRQEKMDKVISSPTSTPGVALSQGQGQGQSAVTAPKTGGFKCDGRRHCSQMTSCEEATLFLRHCPGVEMDGNNDGVPCEKQWCR